MYFQDLLYDRDNNRGYLLNRLCHIRNKLYKTEVDSLQLNPSVETTKKRLSLNDKTTYKRIKISEATEIPPNIEEEFLILKHLNVRTQKEKIKDKLKFTLKYRREAIQNPAFSKLSEAFPFFFVSPDLVGLLL